MTPNEDRLIQFLREHNDPRVWDFAFDTMQRLIAGESIESIAASHGVNWEEVAACHQKKN